MRYAARQLVRADVNYRNMSLQTLLKFPLTPGEEPCVVYIVPRAAH